MRTTRGPWWPTVVLTLSVAGLLLADLMTLATWRAGYVYPYEYWREGSLGPIAYGVVGWLIAKRVPGNRLGVVMLTIPAVGAVQAVAGNLELIGFHHGWVRWSTATAAGVFHAAQTVGVGLIVAVLLLVPSGRTLSRFFHWCLVALAVGITVAASADLLLGTTHDSLKGGPAHIGLAPESAAATLHTLENASFDVFLVVLLVAMVGIVLRWIRADVDERRQVTWVSLGALAGPLLIITFGIAEQWLPAWVTNGSDVWAIAGVLLPLGIAVAVLRHGLYELDTVVSRTVSYAIVTGVVVAIYAVLVTAISQLAPGSDNLAVAAATLAAAASVRPLLRAVRVRVDRRFNRTRFDAELAVHDFATSLRSVVNPDQIVHELTGVLGQTVEPRGVSVWLRSPS